MVHLECQLEVKLAVGATNQTNIMSIVRKRKGRPHLYLACDERQKPHPRARYHG